MSLIDRTNEEITLSQHEPLKGENEVGAYFHEPALYVDADSDSSFTPSSWVGIHFTDAEHDSDRIKLTYEEAGLLHDRLGLILGRPKHRPLVDWAREHLDIELAPWQWRMAERIRAQREAGN